MRAITICQPYPFLILIGDKPVENRTWNTNYRGPLLIHAGRSREWLDDDDEEMAREHGMPLVFGAVVGKCDLVECVPVERIFGGHLDSKYPQLKERNHCNGPFCWVLTNVMRLEKTIPYRGALGFFNVPDHLFEGATWLK